MKKITNAGGSFETNLFLNVVLLYLYEYFISYFHWFCYFTFAICYILVKTVQNTLHGYMTRLRTNKYLFKVE